MDSGHTAWMLVASALVFFMTPGLAFFYGGLVRVKNLVNTIMFSFMSIVIVSIVWVLWGYSLTFQDGGSLNSFIGDFSAFGLSGIDVNSGDSYPALIDVLFQMMFAIITPALITGAFVERFGIRSGSLQAPDKRKGTQDFRRRAFPAPAWNH